MELQTSTGVKLTDNEVFFDTFTILAYKEKFEYVDDFEGELKVAHDELKAFFFSEEDPLNLEFPDDDLREFVKRLYDFRAMATLEEEYGDIVAYDEPIDFT